MRSYVPPTRAHYSPANHFLKYLLLIVIGFAPVIATAQTVSVSATDAQAAEDDAAQGTFTFSRTGNTNSTLSVLFTLSGSATRNSDYSINPASASSIQINAGQASATLVITPIVDNRVEGNEVVTLTLRESTNYTLDTNNLVGQVTIADDPVTVSIVATDGAAAEENQDPGTFTFTRTNTGDFNATLSVSFTLSGSAARNSDYSITPNTASSIQILAGQASAVFTVTPLLDNQVEGNEVVIATLRDNTAYLTDTSNQVGQIQIEDDPVTVSVSATDSEADEDGLDQGSYTFTRTNDGNINAPLTVVFTLGGTASRNADYSPNPNSASSIQILAGQTSAIYTISPIADNLVEGNEVVTLSLTQRTTHLNDTNNQVAEISIKDDPVTVSVTAPDSEAAEERLDPATFRFSRTQDGNFNATLTVSFTISGDAVRNRDYSISPSASSVQILPGQTSSLVTVTPIADALDEPAELIIATLRDSTAYLTSTSSPLATITLTEFLSNLFRDDFEN